MIRVMLDEMISPSLVARLWDEGVDTICARDRALLSSSDARLWQYAQRESRAVVTGNIAHFESLAKSSPTHHGILAMPEGGTREMQFDRVMAGVNWARMAGNDEVGLTDIIAYIDEAGQVVGRLLTANNDNYLDQLTTIAGKVIPIN